MPDLLAPLGLAAVNDGAWTGTTAFASGPAFNSLNPSTGELLAAVRAPTRADAARVIDAAVGAADAWRRVPAPRRGEAVRRVGVALREERDALGRLVSAENGKILAEGIAEVQEMIDIADFAVGQSRMLYGLTMHSERARHRLYEQWHPLGAIGVVTAFNFPVAVWAWNALIGAVAGDVTVWKPSPKAPLVAIAVQRIVAATLDALDLPPAFHLLAGDDPELTWQLVDDRRLPLISFTGSTAVGREVAVRVAGRLGRSLLELGGNNALIVDEYANLDLAVPSIVFGAIGTSGQRCTTTRRVLVHDARAAELERRLVAAYRGIRIGNALDPAVLMGPLIDAGAVARFAATLREAVNGGGELLCGGDVLAAPGHFVTPAIVRAPRELKIVGEETFAPILYLQRWRDLDEAIALQNSTDYGLSSAIFTDRLQHAEQFLSAVGSDCGIANVNIGTSGAEIGGAFGGEKDTGGGRESGSDAWKAYMRRQTSTINYGTDLPLAQGLKFDIPGNGHEPPV